MIDGEPWTINDKDVVTITCCDCNLVHLLSIDIKGKRVTLKHYRDTHLTKKYRKEDGIIVYKRKSTTKSPPKSRGDKE